MNGVRIVKPLSPLNHPSVRMQNSHMQAQADDEDRTTSIGLARYAYDYIHAAMVVEMNDSTPSHISPVPAYFLALHGIELTLKACLRHKGISVKDLQKKFGHDLHACHRKAKELGLHEIFKERPVDADAMRMLVGLNDAQGLRYIKTGMKHFPLWSIVEPLAVRLHQAVAANVGFDSFLKSYQGYD
jgi:hypothetical protein